MTHEALADRVINYCDALAAFSLLNALAFVVTLADPDIRCSIADIAAFVIAADLVISALITLGLVALRRFERSLRKESSDPRVDRFWSWAQRCRLALVWAVALLVSGGVYAASQDLACAAV